MSPIGHKSFIFGFICSRSRSIHLANLLKKIHFATLSSPPFFHFSIGLEKTFGMSKKFHAEQTAVSCRTNSSFLPYKLQFSPHIVIKSTLKKRLFSPNRENNRFHIVSFPIRFFANRIVYIFLFCRFSSVHFSLQHTQFASGLPRYRGVFFCTTYQVRQHGTHRCIGHILRHIVTFVGQVE